MARMKNRVSIKHPFLLDDVNYDHWKVHMSIFIKSLEMEVWQSVVTGWSVPTKIENGETMIKPRS